jgi:membrane protein DedA with SNARE-associated domain
LGYPVFLLASLAGRGTRFFGIGLLIYFFGPVLQGLLEDYLGWTTLALGVLLVLAYALSRYSSSRFNRRGKDKKMT